jgi:hypothetical protein
MAVSTLQRVSGADATLNELIAVRLAVVIRSAPTNLQMREQGRRMQAEWEKREAGKNGRIAWDPGHHTHTHI